MEGGNASLGEDVFHVSCCCSQGRMSVRFKKTVAGKNTTLQNNKRALFKLTMVSVCCCGSI